MSLLAAALEDFPMSASERWIGFLVWCRCFLSNTKLIFSFRSGGTRPSAICRSTMSSGGNVHSSDEHQHRVANLPIFPMFLDIYWEFITTCFCGKTPRTLNLNNHGWRIWLLCYFNETLISCRHLEYKKDPWRNSGSLIFYFEVSRLYWLNAKWYWKWLPALWTGLWRIINNYGADIKIKTAETTISSF